MAHTGRWIPLLLAAILAAVMALRANADATEDFIEGAGEVGKFAIDVVEDFALDEDITSAEESGKARLKDFLKGKTLGWLKNELTGGDDISAGMALILHRIFEALGQHRRGRAGRGGMCELAAISQAWAIAFDAKNLRLLRGSANVVYDLLTSAIPDAPALAEKLVMSFGTAVYKQVRAQVEKTIKDAWAKRKDEAFRYARKAGPCSLKMTVLWNKKKNKYMFLITGQCGCKPVGFAGGSIAMRSFTVLGGGTVTPELDVRNPQKPKVRLRLGPARYRTQVDCNCGAAGTYVQPPREKKPVTLPWAGRIESPVSEPRCPACQGPLDVVNRYVGDFNKLADEMDRVRMEVKDQPYDTPQREEKIKEWYRLKDAQERVEGLHDTAFRAFVACERKRCARGTERFVLETTDEARRLDTGCKACESLLPAANELVDRYNAIVGEMNSIAKVTQRTEVRFGTRLGNDAWDRWQTLSKKLPPLAAQIQGKAAELSRCSASKCGGGRWEPWIKLRPRTTLCAPCRNLVAQYNEAVKKQNAIADAMNAYLAAVKQWVLAHGDAPGPGAEGVQRLQKKHKLHELNRQSEEVLKEIDRLWRLIRDCEARCRADSGAAESSIGGQPSGGAGRPSDGSGALGLLPPRVTTRCPRYCRRLVLEYDAFSARLEALRERERKAGERLSDAEDALREQKDSAGGILFGERFVAGDRREVEEARAERSRIRQKIRATEARMRRIARVDLPACERQCATVRVLQAFSVRGPNFWDFRDVERAVRGEDDAGPAAGSTTQPAGGAPVPTVDVIFVGPRAVPVRKLNKAGPDACPGEHYHSPVPVDACDGTPVADPDPPVCGYGLVSATVAIPLSTCANP